MTSCLFSAIKCPFFSAINLTFSTNLNFIYGTTFSLDFFLNFANSPKIPEKNLDHLRQPPSTFFCMVAMILSHNLAGSPGEGVNPC